MKRGKKGFTLIEMLVVIAIIAILVAIIVPTVSHATKKAKAATDAANLRTVLSEANIELVEGTVDTAAVIAKMQSFECKLFPGATGYIYYEEPGFIEAYYVIDGTAYNLDYFAAVAEGDNSVSGTDVSGTPAEADGWYVIGSGSSD